MEGISIKLILIAIAALLTTVKVFSGAKPLPTVVGFCGVFVIYLLVVNTIIAKIN
jgi:hypothetical protein